MTTRFRFFDSTAGDRIYTADAWAQVIAAMTDDGVAFAESGAGAELGVLEDGPAAQSVEIAPGRIFIQGRYFEVYGGNETLAIGAAHATLPRIDRVVVRLDPTARTVALAVKAGTAAASPVAPTLTQTPGGTWEITLAQIDVPAASTSVIQSRITDERVGAVTRGATPSGAVTAFAGGVPAGWLLAAGGAVSRTVYARLFAVIGVIYGTGDGSTTFNLPDLGDRMIMGTGVTFDDAGAAGGNLEHDHLVADHDHPNTQSAIGVDVGVTSTVNRYNYQVTGSKADHTHNVIADGPGQTQLSSSMPPFLVLVYCIKT